MDISDLKKYDYTLPPELIRKEGVEPRDSARLFVYDTRTDTVTFDTFAHLAQYLPERALLVLNDTKVLPARLWLKKETGGKIEVFVLANEIQNSVIPALEPESGSRVRPGMTKEIIPVLVDRKTEVGQKLFFPNLDYFEVVGQNENVFSVKLSSASGRTLYDLLEAYGETPLPHYLEGDEIPCLPAGRLDKARNDREKVLRKRYQTVFASAGASVAAPTASLHFTERVFQSLEDRGIKTARLTLNVGLGTFAPLREESFALGRLHTEYADVSEETAGKINAAKKDGHSVVAVGTTVTRTLESLNMYTFRNCEKCTCSEKSDDDKINNKKKGEGVRAYAGKTDIFIYPPYQFQVVDHLITNFHLPQTSLMLLVDAFLEHKGAKRRIMDLYAIAIEEQFAFYSFGDSMLIL